MILSAFTVIIHLQKTGPTSQKLNTEDVAGLSRHAQDERLYGHLREIFFRLPDALEGLQ